MKKLVTFICDRCKAPTAKELEECLVFAHETDCVVGLKWFDRYRGFCEVIIRDEMTVQDCKNRVFNMTGTVVE